LKRPAKVCRPPVRQRIAGVLGLAATAGRAPGRVPIRPIESLRAERTLSGFIAGNSASREARQPIVGRARTDGRAKPGCARSARALPCVSNAAPAGRLIRLRIDWVFDRDNVPGFLLSQSRDSIVRIMNRDLDRDQIVGRLAVSRETGERLDAYVDLLRHWQSVKNLVAASTIDQIWQRHVFDSAQLFDHLKGARVVADLGSGAGFPGLVLAILLSGQAGARVHLVESNGRKASFLREAARVTAAPATVHPVRIEAFTASVPSGIEIVTARALASLSELLALSEGLLKAGARALFLKGQDVEQELTQATKSWRISSELIPSLSDPSGRIVHIASAERRVP